MSLRNRDAQFAERRDASKVVSHNLNRLSRAANRVFELRGIGVHSRRRTARIAQGRLACYWVGAYVYDLPDPPIADFFGKDRTTVTHGLRAADRKARVDQQFNCRLQALISEVGGTPDVVPMIDPSYDRKPQGAGSENSMGERQSFRSLLGHRAIASLYRGRRYDDVVGIDGRKRSRLSE
jgi:hypothetical protein